MSTVKISVIVPTYNRLRLLKDQLSALMSQSIPKDLYEVIVVDDGSSDGTGAYLDRVNLDYSNLQTYHQRNGGPAKARNTALKVAQGEIIAFTDDDCVVDKNWLANILSRWNKDLVGIQGATYTDRQKVTPLTHQIDNETGHNSVPTCNAAYSRTMLWGIGGFDESFPSPHNEDADVSWRMQSKGKVIFCPDMRVYHPPRVDAFWKVARRMKIMESEFTLFQKSPSLYRRYRGKDPLTHIYGQVFFRNIGYHFLSKIKLWRRPMLMVQGMAIAIIWWGDLLRRFPSFWKLSRKISEKEQGAGFFEGSSLTC